MCCARNGGSESQNDDALPCVLAPPAPFRCGKRGFRGRESGLECAPHGVLWESRMRAAVVAGAGLLGGALPAAADIVRRDG